MRSKVDKLSEGFGNTREFRTWSLQASKHQAFEKMAVLKVAAFLGIVTALVAVLIAWYTRENFDPETLRGKKVVICGASTGIGEELAYQYAKLGAQLLLVARREEELKKVVARCGDLGAQTANYVVADLSSLEAAKHLAEVRSNQLNLLALPN